MAEVANTGIYEIVNLVNGKRYIGSAIDIGKRWQGHLKHLKRGSHHSRHLQAAWAKYDSGAFEFRRLLICAVGDLLLYEQAAFDSLRPEYNVNPSAGSSLGRRFTAETKAKIAAKAIGRKRSRESVEAGAAKRRGVPLSPETPRETARQQTCRRTSPYRRVESPEFGAQSGSQTAQVTRVSSQDICRPERQAALG